MQLHVLYVYYTIAAFGYKNIECLAYESMNPAAVKFEGFLYCCMLTVPCSTTAYGCCPNGVDPAFGPNFAGCDSDSSPDCASTHYGCCLDGISTAEGPDFAGCPSSISIRESESECRESAYGCCEDGVTPAYGPHSSGCPERIKYGGNSFVVLEIYTVIVYNLHQ